MKKLQICISSNQQVIGKVKVMIMLEPGQTYVTGNIKIEVPKSWQ